MNKLANFRLLLLINGIFLISDCLHASEKISTQEQESPSGISSKILETIKYSEDVPGLKSEEFSAIKPEIIKIWNTLIEKQVLEISGKDQAIRPYFVALQGIIEHVLASEL